MVRATGIGTPGRPCHTSIPVRGGGGGCEARATGSCARSGGDEPRPSTALRAAGGAGATGAAGGASTTGGGSTTAGSGAGGGAARRGSDAFAGGTSTSIASTTGTAVLFEGGAAGTRPASLFVAAGTRRRTGAGALSPACDGGGAGMAAVGLDGAAAGMASAATAAEEAEEDEGRAAGISPSASLARERRFTTVGRMRSSTTSGDFCRSRWRRTRSTTSASTALM